MFQRMASMVHIVFLLFAFTRLFQKTNAESNPYGKLNGSYAAAVFMDSGWHDALEEQNILFCGGALISDRHVLTAANCLEIGDGKSLFPAENVTVALKTKGAKFTDIDKRSVKLITVHEKYLEKIRKGLYVRTNDIALLELTEPLNISEPFKPIHLSQEKLDNGKPLYYTSWDDTTDDDQPLVNHSMDFKMAKALGMIQSVCKNEVNHSQERQISKEEMCVEIVDRSYYGRRYEAHQLVIQKGKNGEAYLGAITSDFFHSVSGKVILLAEQIAHYITWISRNTGNTSFCSNN